MEPSGLIALALVVLAFGVYSKRLSHGLLTAPMVFAAFGVALGSEALGIMHLEEGAGVMHTTAELTLIHAGISGGGKVLVVVVDRRRAAAVLLTRGAG